MGEFVLILDSIYLTQIFTEDTSESHSETHIFNEIQSV